MQYSQEALEEMSQNVDLLDYASHSVDFVKHFGNLHYAICPFHSEKTASLVVNSDENFFYCFGCGKHGDIYNWIQWTENLTFPQAVQKVASIAGFEASDYTESETVSYFKTLLGARKTQNQKEIERISLDIEADYKQKFKDEAPAEWIEEGITKEELEKYEIRIDQSSNRIVYPVYSNDDKFISVKGRTRFKDYKALKITKYINYYKLGGCVDYFQGMQQARPYINESGEILIFEGIKSVMKVDQWGFHNAVSAETSTINESQVRLLIKMHVKNVVIAFDKDVTLKKINGFTQLLKKFTNVYVVIDKWKLLDEKDSPCDKGKDVWNTLYERKVRI